MQFTPPPHQPQEPTSSFGPLLPFREKTNPSYRGWLALGAIGISLLLVFGVLIPLREGRDQGSRPEPTTGRVVESKPSSETLSPQEEEAAFKKLKDEIEVLKSKNKE